MKLEFQGQIHSQLYNQFGDQLRKTKLGLQDKLNNQLSIRLSSQLDNQLRSQLWNQFNNQLSYQLRNQFYSQLYYPLKEIKLK